MLTYNFVISGESYTHNDDYFLMVKWILLNIIMRKV